MAKIWYQWSGKQYEGDDPVFYNPENYSWTDDFEEHWGILKNEISRFLDEKDISFVPNNYKGIEKGGGWSSLTFLFWGVVASHELKNRCPQLTKYLNRIPGLLSVSFSQLAPHSDIARHRGDTNSVIRCHLGTEVPDGIPACGMKVDDEERGWEEGKWLFFNDAHIHSAWNHTDKRRIVLIIDVIRPELATKMFAICTRVLMHQIYNNYKQWNKTIFKSPLTVKKVACLIYLAGVNLLKIFSHSLNS